MSVHSAINLGEPLATSPPKSKVRLVVQTLSRIIIESKRRRKHGAEVASSSRLLGRN